MGSSKKTLLIAAICISMGHAACTRSESSASGAQSALGAAPTKPARPTRPAVRATPAAPAKKTSCGVAIDISSAVNSATVLGSTTNTKNTMNASCGSATSNEIVYSIRAEGAGQMFATTANPGTNYDTVLSVRTSCNDASTQIACNDDCVGLASCVSWAAAAGQTYYLIVEGFASSTGDFELLVNQTPALPETCDAAVVVQDVTSAINSGTSLTGTTLGGSDYEESTCGAALGAPEVIYSVTPANDGNITASLANPGTDYDSVLSVRLSCGGAGTEIVCNDDCVGLQSCATWPAIHGQTYFLIIEGFGGGSGNYELTLTQNVSGTTSGSARSLAATPAEPATPSAPAVPGGPGGPAIPPTFVLPDLTVDQERLASSWFLDERYFAPGDCTIEEGCTGSVGLRRLLRFDTTIRNVGLADYILGDPSASDNFEEDVCHGHYHYSSYAQYRLRDLGGALLMTGGKSGFCVLDVECDPGVTPQYSCGNQGITAGCGDTYGAYLDCQWLDITDVPSGDYVLEVEANWQRSPAEATYTNNTAQAFVHIPSPPVCGNGTCEGGEACDTCSSDCGACGACSHIECEVGPPLSPGCSECTSIVCGGDPYCCDVLWDNICTQEADDLCTIDCYPDGI